MVKHKVQPSIDLESASPRSTPAVLVRRLSTLSIRPGRDTLHEHEHESTSQHPNSLSPSLQSPGLSPRGSPLHRQADSSAFSTLPPSPPRANSAFRSSTGAKDPWPMDVDPSSYGQRGYLATPPDSIPGSARIGGAFQMAMAGGVTVVQGRESREGTSSEASDSTKSSLDEEDASRTLYSRDVPKSPALAGANAFLTDGKPLAKKRPSFILTSAPPMERYDSDATLDSPIPSPRFRRQYPNEPSTSPLPSPTDGRFPNSTSPSGSPSTSHPSAFLSPHIPYAGSSTSSSSSSKLTRQPSSPLIATFNGLVRRSSNNALNAGLPTSRSTSPSRSPKTSPLLSGGSPGPGLGIRRPGFANQAREKVKEKEEEMKERERKKAGSHIRMFSWAERPGEKLGRSKMGTGMSLKRKILLGVLLLSSLGVLAHWMSGSGGGRKEAVGARPTTIPGARLRRGKLLGSSFIHPDVVHRRTPPSASLASVPWRWLRRVLVLDPPLPHSSSRRSGGTASPQDDKKPAVPLTQKHKNTAFVAAPPVAYSDHHPLPPPLIHSDDPERDTLVLYRVLGNDLPPRHSPGQTLRNLRFLLQYESDFSSLSHLGPHVHHHSNSYGSGSGSKKSHSNEGGLRVDKYFILNRIVEPDMVNAIVGLLHLYSVPNSRILVIPFDWHEYQTRSFRWDGGVDKYLGWGMGPQDGLPSPASKGSKILSSDFVDPLMGELAEARRSLEAGSKQVEERKRKGDMLAKLRALDFTYHEKNLYAMNNVRLFSSFRRDVLELTLRFSQNGGRNFALEHGRALPNARWILPLDGNSFLTPAAMDSIVTTLSISGEGPTASRYLIIPMARLLDNDDVLTNNSIALVPKHPHDGERTAKDDAELHHRPDAAPDTPEEPQVGFRYDSTESFQEAMRYGRRSKLELLWRLGAIPYARALDRRTLPWESSDREHVTVQTWGSIPGVVGADLESAVHQPHGETEPGGASNPERGPLAYSKAGWVYRLFSGDKSQEEHSSEAITLRNVNRIKGIAAFLERMDERIARGAHGCEVNDERCGFSSERLWSFDNDVVDQLRRDHHAGQEDVVAQVEGYEAVISTMSKDVQELFSDRIQLSESNAQLAATNASLLAVAGFITGNASYSMLSASLINARFARPTPLFYRQNEQREQMRKYQNLEPDYVDEDGSGYAFPTPQAEDGRGISWSASKGLRLTGSELAHLAFDPMEFDVSLRVP